MLDLIRHIQYAKARNLHVFFSTNGQLLTKEKCSQLLGTGLDAIRISIEGTDKESYESIRRGGSYEVLIRNLIQLKNMRDRQKKSSLKIQEDSFHGGVQPAIKIFLTRGHRCIGNFYVKNINAIS